jgi:hypothetical protein
VIEVIILINIITIIVRRDIEKIKVEVEAGVEVIVNLLVQIPMIQIVQ